MTGEIARPGLADGDWDSLDWKARRERRFQRWLHPAGITFHNGEARGRYEERVRLLIDAIELCKSHRVPVAPTAGFFVARYSGLTVQEAMTDYARMAYALTRYHEDFAPDFQGLPSSPARVFELLGLKFIRWPGHGVSEQTPWQYVEAEYMEAEEYDRLMADPSDYFRQTFLPRVGSAFAPLARLERSATLLEASTMPLGVLPFADSDVIDGLRRLGEAGRECQTYLAAMDVARIDAIARLGIPVQSGGLVKAPYDCLADTLRGTRGIVTDRFRRPEKILEAAERFVPIMIDWAIHQASTADSPLVIFVLHKGADGFMSDADFRTFYWPTLKAVILGLIQEGIVPALFAEGGYNRRLEVVADEDIPEGSVIWMFDQTDMVAAKRALGGRACIAGNVPSSLLALGSATEVEEYVLRLLNTCATDGGFILQTGAVVDDATPEGLKAMIKTGREWRA